MVFVGCPLSVYSGTPAPGFYSRICASGMIIRECVWGKGGWSPTQEPR